MNSIAFFDFDGTITRKDSFPAFIVFQKGYLKFFSAALIFAPRVLLAGLLKKDPGKIKEKWFSFHFKGMKEAELKQSGTDFMEHLVKSGSIQEKMLSIITNLQKEGAVNVIVSASPDIWIRPVSRRLQMDYICTEIEFRDGFCTGKFSTPNCKGEQKKIRIQKKYNLHDYSRIIVYGDSSGDIQMMDLATEPHWV